MLYVMPVDPCFRAKSAQSAMDACREAKHLNDGFLTQYGYMWSDLLRLDLGDSWQHVGLSVVEVLSEGLPHTLSLIGLALSLALVLGVFFGTISAARRNSKTDYTIMGLAGLAIANPEFVVGPVVILVFTMKLGWLPRTQGLEGPSSYLLPVLVLALPMAARMARLVRVGLLEELGRDHIRTAHAKGLSEKRILFGHALRLGLGPAVTYTGLLVASMVVGGSFIVEVLFGIPGIGLHLIQAVTSSPIDYPMVQAGVILLATVLITANFLVDIIYAILDPRLRAEVTGGSSSQGSWVQGLVAAVCLAGVVGLALMGAAALGEFNEPMVQMMDRAGKSPVSALIPPILSVIMITLAVWVEAKRRRALSTTFASATKAQQFWKQFSKHRIAVMSMATLFLVALSCVLVPWVWEQAFGVQYDMGVLRESRQAPPFAVWLGVENVSSWLHPFGTDKLGRDLFVRVLMGGRVSISVGLVGFVIATSIGLLYGTASAYFGKSVDNVMMRFVDILICMPYILFVILLMGFAGKSILLLYVAIGCVSWLGLARVTRGEALSVKQMEFVQAARCMGASHWRIITRHLMPNVLGPVIIYAAVLVGAFILDESFLSFLGLGVQEPMASWGILIRQGNEMKETMWWLLVFRAGALVVTVLSLLFIGDGVRDAMDPKLRGRQ